MSKKNVICFINQFFGGMGGEAQADTGFSLVERPLGPALLVNSLISDWGQVVATLICGDNYFAENPEQAIQEGLELVEGYKADLFLAGPAFNAGRYGLNCGNLCAAVQEELGIPTLTAMYHENPAVELFRDKTLIVKAGISASKMKSTADRMTAIGKKMVLGLELGSAEAEGYFSRNIIRNEMTDKQAGIRAVEMMLKKVKGEPFESEMTIPQFDFIEPPRPIEAISEARIALLTDGGLVPEGNPDGLRSFSNTAWGKHAYVKLFNDTAEVVHDGYDSSLVLEDKNRLLPLDVLTDLQEEDRVGYLDPEIYVWAGNAAGIRACQSIGAAIAQDLLAKGIQGAILTST